MSVKTDRKNCITLPPKVNSNGFGDAYAQNRVIQFSLPQLELQMVVIFTLTQLCHFLLRRLGATPFVSQLLAGMILSTIVRHDDVVMRYLFPLNWLERSGSQAIIDAVEFLGYTFFFFLTGAKMDMGMLFKVGKKAWVIGVSSMVSLVFSIPTLGIMANKYKLSEQHMFQLSSLMAIQSFSAFPVIYQLLNDLKVLNTELGRLALCSSLVSNIAGILLTFSASIFSMPPDKKWKNLGMTLSFFTTVMLVIRPAMKWMIQQTPEGKPVKDRFVHTVLIIVLLSAIYSDVFGQSVVFGAFFVGLAVPVGPPLGSALVEKLDCFFLEMFMPLYVTISALKVDFDALRKGLPKMNLDLFIVTFVFIIKFVASVIPPIFCKMPINDAVTIALVLCCKGIVELGTYRYMVEVKKFSQDRYTLSVIALLLNAAAIPIVLNHLLSNSRKYGGYQKRNVTNLRHDTRLPVLACIHTPDNISSMLRLIDSCQSAENAMSVNVLHLVKLLGQATPIFISHQMQNKVDGNKSYSDNVILAFMRYARGSSGKVQASMFTAISPPKLMHEDICYLALDKNVSLILLPFHRKWSNVDGAVEYEDTRLRTLNSSVLQRAPCSVGILIDRGHRGPEEDVEFTVGMLFLGGGDDREALSLAKRMATNPRIHLRVVEICHRENNSNTPGMIMSWDRILDMEMLRDVKDNHQRGNMSYAVEIVEDGPETAKLVREMVYEFNLVIVGRRYGVECAVTSGLQEWAELPELGVLGDLLASSDLDTKASALVIQQQQYITS
ncbi:hypothetical protein MLD38_005501 [Melastoma candidum]|uniref:Uncharacterized protein n=1 Tax=Melastoma candidum TaxID=119954 RepID=A0ACB9RJ83_9MYRT|nr:hypothetical protein MLD38_005501 [Melastoma candidum]